MAAIIFMELNKIQLIFWNSTMTAIILLELHKGCNNFQWPLQWLQLLLWSSTMTAIILWELHRYCNHFYCPSQWMQIFFWSTVLAASMFYRNHCVHNYVMWSGFQLVSCNYSCKIIFSSLFIYWNNFLYNVFFYHHSTF